MVGTQAEDEVNAHSQMQAITYAELASKVEDKCNFLFLLKGSDDLCQCWADFHNKCLAPYVKAKHLLVYWMDLDSFEKEKEHYDVPRYANHDTLAVFENGKVVASRNNQQDEAWGKDPFLFNAWMAEVVATPKVYQVSQAQLDALYEGTSPTGENVSRPSIYYFRGTCPDCSYLTTHDLRDYFASRTTTAERLYAFDADEWKRDGIDYPTQKINYGLAQTETNPLGYGEGAFPTILSFIPNHGEKISSIDQMGVFYNEKIDNDVISNSYFTETRIADPEAGLGGALSYALSVNPNILEGQKAGEGNTKHDRLHSLTYPLVKALLDEIL